MILARNDAKRVAVGSFWEVKVGCVDRCMCITDFAAYINENNVVIHYIQCKRRVGKKAGDIYSDSLQ